MGLVTLDNGKCPRYRDPCVARMEHFGRISLDAVDHFAKVQGFESSIATAQTLEIEKIGDQFLHPFIERDQTLQTLLPIFFQPVLIVLQEKIRVVVGRPKQLLQIMGGDISKIIQFLVAAFKFLIGCA